MITEVMKISEPPYTNRGVTRQKEDLTALIDWCQITVKGVDVFIIIEDILRIPLSFMELHGKEKGIAGHELIARFDNIKILKPTGNAQYEGFQILMSGSGCRNYENFLMMNKETWFDFLERVCRYPVNFPRIDLAIDDTKPYLSIPELIRLKNEGLISSQLRDTAENRSDRLKEDEIEAQGKTLYLGSKHSDFRITFYEKGYEQAEKFGKELNPDWNRYELRFRHKKAVRLVEELLKDRDVARIALSVLNEKVRFLQKPENSTVTRKRLYPTYPPWEELMQDVGKIKLTMNPKKKILERPLIDYLDCNNKEEVLGHIRNFISINTSAVHQALPFYVLKDLRLVAGMHTAKEYSVGLALQFPDLPSLKSESAIRQSVGFLKTAKYVIKEGKDQLAPLIESDENQELYQKLVQTITDITASNTTDIGAK